MPCCDKYEEDYTIITNELSKENSELRAMLCSTARELENRNYDFNLNPMLAKWWEKHKEDDLEKVKEEFKKELKRQIAEEMCSKHISQLTKEDKKFLKEEGYL